MNTYSAPESENGKYKFGFYAACVVLTVFLFYHYAVSTSQKNEAIRLRDELGLKNRRIAQLERRAGGRSSVPADKRLQVTGVSWLDVQNTLKAAELYAGPFDGAPNEDILAAVREFQRREGLKPDGIIGKRTWQRLMHR